jgi:hypothetical protein
VRDRALVCEYCRVDLNVIGENLGSLILSNVEAVKAALAQGQYLGLQGRHLEPVAFKDLNREYFMPLFEHTDRGVVLGRLVEGADEPSELLIDYQVLFPGEDAARIKVDWVRKTVFSGAIHQWFGGWRRCPSCSGRYHISRVVSSERELHDADDCPLCATRELAEQLESVQRGLEAELEDAGHAVPKKRGWFNTAERERYEDAVDEVAFWEALVDEWSSPSKAELIEEVAALAQTPLVGREAASERREIMRELEHLAAGLRDGLQPNGEREPRPKRDAKPITRQPRRSQRSPGLESLAAVPVVLGLAVLFVWGVPSVLPHEQPRGSQSGTSVSATSSATTTKPGPSKAKATPAIPPRPTFEPMVETGTGPAVFALPSRVASSVIETTYKGRSSFILDVVSDEGTQVARLVERDGPYSGTTFVEPARDYPFLLKVNARGKWKITITPDTTLASLDRSTSGNGDTVLRSLGHPGKWRFTYSGKSYFRVRLVGGEDDHRLRRVKSSGPYRRTVRLRSGKGLVLIKADGPWSIKVP